MRYRSLLAIVVAATSLAFACQMVQGAEPPQTSDVSPEEVDVMPGRLAAGAVAVQSNYAYVGIGPSLVVVDVSDPRRPTPVGHAGVWPDERGRHTGVVNAVAVSGNYAYVGRLLPAKVYGDADMVVFDVSNPEAPAQVASYSLVDSISTGTLDVAVSGKYAYVYHESGLEVLDVSDPRAPKLVGSWTTHGGGGGTSSDVFENRHLALVGHYAYVADRKGGLRVLDVSAPASPKEVGSYDTRGPAWTIAVVGKHALVNTTGRLLIIDISDTQRPTEVGFYEPPKGDDRVYFLGGGTGGIAAVGNYAFLYSKARVMKARLMDRQPPRLTTWGPLVLDISDPRVPSEVHPGQWEKAAVKGPIMAMAVQGRYAYLANARQLVVADISDPKNPAVVGSTAVLPCALVDLAVAGNYVFAASGRGGLRVLDVSGDDAPKEVGSFRATEPITTLTLEGNRLFAGTPGTLLVLDVSDPKAPRQVSAYNTGRAIWTSTDGVRSPMHVADVATFDKYVCVTAGTPSGYYSTVRVLDFSRPEAPKVVGVYPSRGVLEPDPKIAVAGEHLLVLEAGSTTFSEGHRQVIHAGLRVLDLSYLAWRPWMPYLVALATAASVGLSLFLWLRRQSIKPRLRYAMLVVIIFAAALIFLLPRGPRNIGGKEIRGALSSMGGSVRALAVSDRYVFVAGVTKTAFQKGYKTESFLQILDVSKPAKMREAGRCGLAGDWPLGVPQAVRVVGNHAYVAGGATGLHVVDVSDPTAPKQIGLFLDGPGFARAVAVDGNKAFLASDHRGLRVLDISDPTAPKPVGFYDSPP